MAEDPQDPNKAIEDLPSGEEIEDAVLEERDDRTVTLAGDKDGDGEEDEEA